MMTPCCIGLVGRLMHGEVAFAAATPAATIMSRVMQPRAIIIF